MPFEKPFVVLPTYNERENVGTMVPKLFSLGVSNLNVLVVDDSSPDGTAQIVQQLQFKYPNLSLLNRSRKEGLGRAYIAGFQEAIQKGADCIIQMDCDFSHDPQDIPRFLKELEETDFIIGSRYVRGGETLHWPLHRLFLSRFANLYAKCITNVPVSDLTGGFKGWRAGCLKGIHLETSKTQGYGFQIETTFRAYKMGFKVKEIPITFTERRVGSSKMRGKIIWEALWLVWKLRFKTQTY